MEVKDGVRGDTLAVEYVSDGSVPAYGPDGTLLKRFGPIKLAGGAGWVEESKPPIDLKGSAKEMPKVGDGIRVELVFDALDANPRELEVRFLVHE